MRSLLKVFLALAVVAGALLGARAAYALCAPSARGIFPASGVVGTTVPATVTGSGLAGVTAQVFGDAGLAAAVQATSDTTVGLTLTIDPAAAPGERIIALANSGGTVYVSFTVNAAGGPIATGVSPTAIATQGFGLVLDIAGQNLAGLTSANVTVSGTGVTVSSATAAGDGSNLSVSLAVAADAEIGTHALVISSDAGGVVLQLYVQRPAPTVTDVSPGAGEVGATVPLTITGTNLTGAALVITSGASGAGGVTISDVATPDDSTLTATLTISGTLSPETEPRLLILTTESGQVTAEFFIVAANGPSLTSIRPGAGSPGQTVPVTLKGNNLTGAIVTTVSLSITLQNIVVVDDETITADVVVSNTATANTNHTIVATVGLATAQTTFRVIATDAPFIGAVRPPFGNRGSTIAIVLDGVNLGTVVSGSGIDVSSSGITESNAISIDAQTARAILQISPTANAGIRDVTVTTATGSFTKNASFRVNIPGQVPIITEVTPSVVPPGTTNTITVTGSGFEGAGVSVGGFGATVSNLSVDVTGTSLTFDLTLAAGVAAENRPLIVVTESGTATCGILSTGAAIDLKASKIVKTGAVFEVLTPGYRLLVFEFSLNERFDSGLRTFVISSATPLMTLTRQQVENIGRAVRDLPFGYVRVRGVSATNQIGASPSIRLRR
jgi:hypothetical protein